MLQVSASSRSYVCCQGIASLPGPSCSADFLGFSDFLKKMFLVLTPKVEIKSVSLSPSSAWWGNLVLRTPQGFYWARGTAPEWENREKAQFSLAVVQKNILEMVLVRTDNSLLMSQARVRWWVGPQLSGKESSRALDFSKKYPDIVT